MYLIRNQMNPTIKQLEYNITLITCESPTISIISSMLNNFPTVKETTRCFLNH